MRIVKILKNGLVGKPVLTASTIGFLPTFTDPFVVAFEAHGLDDDGEQQKMLVALTRNELAALIGWVEKHDAKA